MASARFYFAPTPCKLGPFTLNSQTVWLQGERFKLSGLDYYMCAIMGSNEYGPASAEDVKAAARNSQPFDFPIEAVWQGPFTDPRPEWIEEAKAEAAAKAPAAEVVRPAAAPAAPAPSGEPFDAADFERQYSAITRSELKSIESYLNRICDLDALLARTVDRYGINVVREPQVHGAFTLMNTVAEIVFNNPKNFSQSLGASTILQSVGWMIWRQMSQASIDEEVRPSLRPLDRDRFRGCVVAWVATAKAVMRWGGLPADSNFIPDANWPRHWRAQMAEVERAYTKVAEAYQFLPDAALREAEKMYSWRANDSMSTAFASSVGAIQHVRRFLNEALRRAPSSDYVEGVPPEYTTAGFLHRWIDEGCRGLNALFEYRNSDDSSQLIEMFRAALNAESPNTQDMFVQEFKSLIREQRPAGASRDEWRPTDPDSAFTKVWDMLADGWQKLLAGKDAEESSDAQSAIDRADQYIRDAFVNGLTSIPFSGISIGAMKCQIFQRHIIGCIAKGNQHPAYVARLSEYVASGMIDIQPLPAAKFNDASELFRYAIKGMQTYLSNMSAKWVGDAMAAGVPEADAHASATEHVTGEAYRHIRAIRHAVLAWRPAGISEADFLMMSTPAARMANEVVSALGKESEVERLVNACLVPSNASDPKSNALAVLDSLVRAVDDELPVPTGHPFDIKVIRSAVYRTEYLFKLYKALEESDRNSFDRLAGMPQDTYTRVESMLFNGQPLPKANTVLSDVHLMLDTSVDSVYHNDFESVLSLLNTIIDFHMRRLALLRPFGKDEHFTKENDPELSRAYVVLRDYRDSPEAKTRDIFMLFPQLSGAVESEALKLLINELRAIGSKHSGDILKLTDALLDEYFNTLVGYANEVRIGGETAKAEFDAFIAGPTLREVFPVYHHQPIEQLREIIVYTTVSEVKSGGLPPINQNIEASLRMVADSLALLLRLIRPLGTAASKWETAPQASDSFELLNAILYKTPRTASIVPQLCDSVRQLLPPSSNPTVEDEITRITNGATSLTSIFEQMGYAIRAIGSIRNTCMGDKLAFPQWERAFSEMRFRNALRFQDVRTQQDVCDLIYLMLVQTLDEDRFSDMNSMIVEASICISQLVAAYDEMRPLTMTPTAWRDGTLMPTVEGQVRTYVGKLATIYSDQELLGGWLYENARDLMPEGERAKRSAAANARTAVKPEGLMKYREPKYPSSTSYVSITPEVPATGLDCSGIFDYEQTVYAVSKVLPVLNASMGGGIYQLDEYILDDLKANSRCIGLKKLPAVGNFIVVGGNNDKAQTCIMTVSSGGKKLGLVIVNFEQIRRIFGAVNTATVMQALTHEFAHYIHKTLKNTALMDWKRAIAGKVLHPRTGADAYGFETEQFAILAETMVWGNSVRGLYKANGIDVVERFFHNNYIPDEDRQRLA